nr:EOG090X00DN [Lepidurus arcticus]
MGSVDEIEFWTVAMYYLNYYGKVKLEDVEDLDTCFDVICDADSYRATRRKRRLCFFTPIMIMNSFTPIIYCKVSSFLYCKTEKVSSFYRACLVSALQPCPSVHSIVKLVATNLIAAGKVWEGAELLCLTDKVPDACRYLQTYGQWDDAAILAKLSLSPGTAMDIYKRWTDNLVAQKQSAMASLVLVSLGQFQKVLELCVVQRQYSKAAFLILACEESGVLAKNVQNGDECNDALIAQGGTILTATSSLPSRGPANARMTEGGAWTAKNSDFQQYLTLDLGDLKNITGIATAGRNSPKEFVMEYAISYGSNGLDYADYKEVDGSVKMFKGNDNGDKTRRISFETPIIAQWIRINPTRWHDRISMKVEVYGCLYKADVLHFAGNSLVRKNLTLVPVSSRRDKLNFRFRTNRADGLLLYSRGTQGDYLALQLLQNRLVLNLNIGSGLMTSMTVGSLLDDNLWHDVMIVRNRRDVIFTVDRVMIKDKIKGDYAQLDLDREFLIGGSPTLEEGMLTIQNFTGCMENFFINGTNVIRAVRDASHEDHWIFTAIKVSTSCPAEQVIPITFLTASSYARLPSYEGTKSLNVSLAFRTYEENGLLAYHKFTSDGSVKEFCCKGEIVFDACQMVDKCTPNPCEHGGMCKQTSEDFYCDCTHTGYTGAVCHASTHPVSCDAAHQSALGSPKIETNIDVDGSGPLPAFPVTCEYFNDGRTLTYVGHQNDQTTVVNGFNAPGSFIQNIAYNADMDQIGLLVNRSYACRQRLRYDCRSSRLFNSPYASESQEFRPNSWWVSRQNLRMDYWAGSLPGSRKSHSGDITFEFRTTQENAVLIHSKGPVDFIKVSIVGGDQIQFTYQAGSGPLGVTVETSTKLNDNQWHSVSVERNRKEARVVVDGALKAEVREPPGPVRAMHLTSPFVVGSTVDYKDGFVGCMRGLMLNGRHMDMRSAALRGLYEIGVNMQSNYMIKYEFPGTYKSTLSENIRVGFTTTNPKGFLMGLFSDISKEYLTLSVSNSGSLRLIFDFGFERREFIFANQTFATGQYHDVRIRREEGGSRVVMIVDNYEPQYQDYPINPSADAQFNNIQYMYLGRNNTITEGFTGCLSRVEFDDIYPLKWLFQQNRPNSIKSFPDAVSEDFCGIEPVTHPPDVRETRPPPNVDEEELQKFYPPAHSAILGGILAVLFIALVCMAILIGRYMSRHKGDYVTQEDKGAENAADADFAVMHSTTGHHVEKKKEWFI